MHRDIKPGNIMFGDDGIKLVDFGLASFMGGEQGVKYSTDFCGTYLYMAPELLESRIHSKVFKNLYVILIFSLVISTLAESYYTPS